jgi:hypothetical protein
LTPPSKMDAMMSAIMPSDTRRGGGGEVTEEEGGDGAAEGEGDEDIVGGRRTEGKIDNRSQGTGGDGVDVDKECFERAGG